MSGEKVPTCGYTNPWHYPGKILSYEGVRGVYDESFQRIGQYSADQTHYYISEASREEWSAQCSIVPYHGRLFSCAGYVLYELLGSRMIKIAVIPSGGRENKRKATVVELDGRLLVSNTAALYWFDLDQLQFIEATELMDGNPLTDIGLYGFNGHVVVKCFSEELQNLMIGELFVDHIQILATPDEIYETLLYGGMIIMSIDGSGCINIDMTVEKLRITTSQVESWHLIARTLQAYEQHILFSDDAIRKATKDVDAYKARLHAINARIAAQIKPLEDQTIHGFKSQGEIQNTNEWRAETRVKQVGQVAVLEDFTFVNPWQVPGKFVCYKMLSKMAFVVSGQTREIEQIFDIFFLKQNARQSQQNADDSMDIMFAVGGAVYCVFGQLLFKVSLNKFEAVSRSNSSITPYAAAPISSQSVAAVQQKKLVTFNVSNSALLADYPISKNLDHFQPLGVICFGKSVLVQLQLERMHMFFDAETGNVLFGTEVQTVSSYTPGMLLFRCENNPRQVTFLDLTRDQITAQTRYSSEHALFKRTFNEAGIPCVDRESLECLFGSAAEADAFLRRRDALILELAGEPSALVVHEEFAQKLSLEEETAQCYNLEDASNIVPITFSWNQETDSDDE